MTPQTVYGHSFIVRVWLEETPQESGRALWRGRVTHVPSHEQRYFQTMQDLVSFVQRYMQDWEGGSDSEHSHRTDE
jgi:hypothetical protein